VLEVIKASVSDARLAEVDADCEYSNCGWVSEYESGFRVPPPSELIPASAEVVISSLDQHQSRTLFIKHATYANPLSGSADSLSASFGFLSPSNFGVETTFFAWAVRFSGLKL
jgi:hypothetical protein